MNWNDYAFVTGDDGELNRSEPKDVQQLVGAMCDADHAVLHLHGGLVSERSAKGTVEALAPVYLKEGRSHPGFIIYRTGLFEILKGHLVEIARESFYQTLVGKVLKWAHGKLFARGGAKSIDAAELLRDGDVQRELEKLDRDDEPFAGVTGSPEVVSDYELEQFQKQLELDGDFQDACREIVEAYIPAEDRASKGARGIDIVPGASRSRLSPDVVGELVGDASGAKGAKGLLSTAKTIVRAGLVLKRVIDRFREGRDHGLYTTVVEEVVRAFYLANVGTSVWEAMKGETSQTFQSDATPRGGRTFVDELAACIKRGRRPKFSVVAHSLGSVYACHLIEDLAACRSDRNHPLPADFSLKNLILLAPAVNYTLFDRVLSRHADLIDNFRMYALTDGLEAGYWEVPGVYPRSLLYLVSGLLERDGQEESVPDMPLVGMQRYFNDPNTYDMPEVTRVRRYLNQPDHLVWSVTDGGPGMSSDARTHGAFDDSPPEPNTMLHVCEMLKP